MLGISRGGHIGITQIPNERAAALDRKWKAFEPVVAEEEPNTFWAGEERASVNHVCPEVSYDIFGYFASDLYHYADEIDHDSDWKGYKREGILDQFDSRWQSIRPRHYTECREFSIHGTFAAGNPSTKPPQRRGVAATRRWQVLARDSFTCVYCGRKPPEVALHVDHKISVKDGGSDELENLVTACDECNAGKSDSSV